MARTAALWGCFWLLSAITRCPQIDTELLFAKSISKHGTFCYTGSGHDLVTDRQVRGADTSRPTAFLGRETVRSVAVATFCLFTNVAMADTEAMPKGLY